MRMYIALMLSAFKSDQLCCMVVNLNIKHGRIRTSCESGHNIDTMRHTVLVHKPSSDTVIQYSYCVITNKTSYHVLCLTPLHTQ